MNTDITVVLMDETSYGREYGKVFEEDYAQDVSSQTLDESFELFDNMLRMKLSDFEGGSWEEYEDYEVSMEWQGGYHHCGGLYSIKAYSPSYIRAVMEVIRNLPDRDRWVYHTVCECDDLWHGEFFIRFPKVYFPKDGQDYFTAFDIPNASIEEFVSEDPMIIMREAVLSGDVHLVKRLIESTPSLIHSKDDSECTPLHHAAKKGHSDLLELLIEEGADVEANSISIGTPMCAASVGDKPLLAVPVLAKVGANLDALVSWGSSPLELASLRGDLELVRLLIDLGASLEAISGEEGPLHQAALSDQVGVAELLVVGGADPNAKDSSGFTPLHRAAYQGSLRVAEYLISCGAHVNARDKRRRTPLAVCGSYGGPAMESLLKEHKGKV